MKKRLSTVYCLVLTLLVTFSCITFTSATDIVSNDTVISSIDTFVQDVCPILYTNIDQSYISYGNYLCTYVVDESGLIEKTDYCVYPLFSNNEIIGLINVSTENGAVIGINTGIDYAPALNKQLSSYSGEFAIFYYNSNVFFKPKNSDAICLTNDAATYTLPIHCDISIDYGIINEQRTISNIATYGYSRTGTQKIPISHVANTSTSCCPNGICWASCIAMLSNSYRNTNYSAKDIHDKFFCLTSGYHSEEKSFMQQLNLVVGGPYYHFTYNDTVDCIDDNIAMLLDLQDSNASVAHNVVANGYSYGVSGSTYLYYVDPNGGQKMAAFPSSGAFTLAVGGYNYTVHCYMSVYG